jgi:hypothetical protein
MLPQNPQIAAQAGLNKNFACILDIAVALESP